MTTRIVRNGFLFLLTLSLLSQAAAFADLEQIRDQAAETPQRLRSYEFVFESRETPTSETYQRVEVQQSENKFRVRAAWMKGGKPLPNAPQQEYAFNGLHYQGIDPEQKTMVVSKTCRQSTPYLSPSPLTYPYYWLTGQQANWSDVKNKDTWGDAFKEAKYIGTEVVDGVEYDVVSFPFAQMNMDKVHVFFAKESGYYPMQSQGFVDDVPVFEFKVTQHKTYDVDGGTLVFPLAAQMRLGETDINEADDVLEIFWTVPEASIKVNPDLNNGLFTFSTSGITKVFDLDDPINRGLIGSSAGFDDDGALTEPEAPKHSLKALFISLLGLAVLSVILARYLKRKAESAQ